MVRTICLNSSSKFDLTSIISVNEHDERYTNAACVCKETFLSQTHCETLKECIEDRTTDKRKAKQKKWKRGKHQQFYKNWLSL